MSSRIDLDVALTCLKQSVVRATLRRKGLVLHDKALRRISWTTPYATLEAERINPDDLDIRSLSGRVGRVLYRVTHLRCLRLLFRVPKAR